MKKTLPVIFIIFIVVFFFNPFLFNNLLPIPADTIVGLYHPFRDLYAKDYPRGIPFKNFLITDPVRQQYPWRKLAVDSEKKIQLPLWNPYNFSGTPLLANFQSAVFYPLNLFLFILPFSFGWGILVFLQPLFAGVFLYFYLRKLYVSKGGAIMGAIAFAFCGFSVAWMQWNTLIQTALWLPLILLAKEYLLEKISLKWILILIFAECSQIFAGHIQTFFYSTIISNLYLIVRIIQISWQTQKEKRIVFAVRKYIPFLVIGILIYVITAIQWLPSLQFVLLSARDTDQSVWQKDGWFIPWQNLVQFIAPDFFGNPATLNYWGIFNYAEFVGYIGILPFLFALFAMTFRYDKKTLFFGSLFFLSLIFALPTPFARIPYFLKIPFISTSQPTRLIFVSDFSLAVLSALGFDYFLKEKKKIIFPIIFVAVIFIFLWSSVVWGEKASGILPENIVTIKHNLVFPSIIFLISSIILISASFLKLNSKNLIIITLLFITVFDLIRFAQKFTPFTPKQYLFPDTQAIKFLRENIGNYRVMADDSRIFPPNFSAVYHIQSVDGYDPVFLKSYAQLIASSERGKPDISEPFGFNRIITPHNYDSKLIDLLGVKYILSLSDISSPKLKKVFQEGETRIYENTAVFPRAFFVGHIISSSDDKDTISKMFSQNLRETAVSNSDKNFYQNNLSQSAVQIVQYFENKVILQTSNSEEGFLVLTDTFYPTWHVTIDTVEEKIYRADYNFRGIFVPKGIHRIIFENSLF